MTPTTFQMPELRDSLDNIIQAGAYGKNTAFCNAQNTGVLDYINNNLMYLWTNLLDEPTINERIAAAKTEAITEAGTNTDTKIAAHNTDPTAHADIREALEHVSGVPIGTIIPFAGNGDLPNGFLLCNRASVARTMYPDLYAVIGTTYGAVDDEHFNLPDLRDKFIEGADVGGTVKEAGLPNITGKVYHSDAWDLPNNMVYGAFAADGEGVWSVSRPPERIDRNVKGGFNFDASRSSSIYGNSTTVQPPALTMRYIIKAFDGQTEESALIDVTQYANELNNIKADYLPLRGGVMRGALLANNDRNFDIGYKYIDKSGAGISFRSANLEGENGAFIIWAQTPTNISNLIGRPNGTFTWNDNPIATTNKLSMPSESHLILSADANPNSYIPPSDGWLNIIGDCTGTTNYAYCDSAFGRFLSFCGSAGIQCRLSVPVAKGKHFSFGWSGLTNVSVRFFYAESAT